MALKPSSFIQLRSPSVRMYYTPENGIFSNVFGAKQHQKERRESQKNANEAPSTPPFEPSVPILYNMCACVCTVCAVCAVCSVCAVCCAYLDDLDGGLKDCDEIHSVPEQFVSGNIVIRANRERMYMSTRLHSKAHTKLQNFINTMQITGIYAVILDEMRCNRSIHLQFFCSVFYVFFFFVSTLVSDYL